MKKLPTLIVTTIISSAIAMQSAMAVEQPTPATDKTEAVAQSPSGKATQYSTEKPIDTIKLYTIEKKDAAIQKAKETMDNIDARMTRLEQHIKEKKSEWSVKIAKKKEEELAELKKAREEVAARYQKLKKATKKAWEAAKDAFIRSVQKFEHKYEKLDSYTLASKEKSHGNAAQNSQANQ